MKRTVTTLSVASISAFMAACSTETPQQIAERCKAELLKGNEAQNIAACNNFDVYVTVDEDPTMAGRPEIVADAPIPPERPAELAFVAAQPPPERPAAPPPATPSSAPSSGGGGGFHVFVFNSGSNVPIASSYTSPDSSQVTRESIINRNANAPRSSSGFRIISGRGNIGVNTPTSSPSVQSRPARPIAQPSTQVAPRGFGATGRGVSGVS